MQKVKQIQLSRGLNIINISSSELGLISSKRPIALLPADCVIQSVSFNTIQKLRSTRIDNQETANSCIRFYNMVGSFDDREKYLTWSSDPADIIGKSSENTGSFFDNPVSESNNIQIFLETWVSTKVWTMESNLSDVCFQNGAFGTQDAAVCAAGYWGGSYQHCEKWNGTSWSTTGSINTSSMRSCGGCGTQTAGLLFGEYPAGPYCEEFNGSTWAIGGSLIAGRYAISGSGTQTAGLTTGGFASSVILSSTEEYNGTAWTSANSLNLARRYSLLSGTQTSSLRYGGRTNSITTYNISESYDGTSWSIDEDIILSREVAGRAGTTSSNGLLFGGQNENNIYMYETQEYNGTWSIGNNANIASGCNGCGTSERALKFGGRVDGGSTSNRTERFSGTNLNEISILGKTKLTFLVS